jgi:hypothetical protein
LGHVLPRAQALKPWSRRNAYVRVDLASQIRLTNSD